MKTTKRTFLAIAAILGIVFIGCPTPDGNSVATPTATPAGGEVADNTAITLATTTADAAIYYTQDGTEPTAESALYSDTDKPVITTGKLTLKAIAVKDGNTSGTLTATYTIATTIVRPTVSITNNNQTVTLAPELEITLNGTATKGTNEIKSYEWTVKTTESGVTPVFTSGTSAVTKVTGIKKAGTYVFELKVKDTADLEGTAEATVTVTPWNATKTINVAEVPFTFAQELKLKLDGDAVNNFSFVGGTTAGFTTADLNGITYTLTSVNPVKDLSDCSNGNIPASKYADGDYPTITQTFYYNGQVVGSRKVVPIASPGWFTNLYAYKPTQFDGVWYDSDFEDIDAIPQVTLTLTKTITEILPPPTVITKTITVPAITTVANPMDFGAVSSLTGWDVDFPSSDIAYILEVDSTPLAAGTTTIFATSLSNGMHTITQTFYYKGNPIADGSRSVNMTVTFGGFATMTGSLVELSLLLVKNVID
jgi:hypothetical protein